MCARMCVCMCVCAITIILVSDVLLHGHHEGMYMYSACVN